MQNWLLSGRVWKNEVVQASTYSTTLWSKEGYLLGGAGAVKDKGEVPVVTIVSIVVVLVTLDTNA